MQPIALVVAIGFGVFSIVRIIQVFRTHIELERNAKTEGDRKFAAANRVRVIGIGVGIAGSLPFGIGMVFQLPWIRDIGIVFAACGAIAMVIGRILRVAALLDRGGGM